MKSIKLTALRDSVLNACIATLKSLDITIDSTNTKAGIVKARTGVSIFSWGNEIELKVVSANWYQHTVIVTSSASSQIIAWGTNEDNETTIINELPKTLYNDAVFCEN